MTEYQASSFEELRMEDYEASRGLFGSTVAKLGAALCESPRFKLVPHQYGELFNKLVGSFKDEHRSSETVSSSVEPVESTVEADKKEKLVSNVNLSFQGNPNVTVVINDDANVHLFFNDKFNQSSESKSKASRSHTRLKSISRSAYNQDDRYQDSRSKGKHEEKTKMSEKKESTK